MKKRTKIIFIFIMILLSIFVYFLYFKFNSDIKKDEFYLSKSNSWNIWNNKEFSFAEFPDTLDKFNKSLLIQEKNLNKSKINSSDYLFYNSYISNLKSAISYFNWGDNLEFSFIKNKYWDKIYNQIKDESWIIIFKYDEYLTQELFKVTSWKVLVESNWFTKQQIFNIYFNFIKDIEFKRLNNLLENEQNNYNKAITDYQLYLLFTDYRLYIN